jgi:hypothetical protein
MSGPRILIAAGGLLALAACGGGSGPLPDGGASDGEQNCVDSDSDGTCDAQDGCPNDINKTGPGACGCGEVDADGDQDGTADCNEDCPSDPNKILPGECGCGTPDVDSDGDGTLDCNEQCPEDGNKLEPGICGCGVPDADMDGDTVLDCNDGCPEDGNKTEPGECGCGTPDVDSDGDGVLDCNEQCPDDPNKTMPEDCGCGWFQLEGGACGREHLVDSAGNTGQHTAIVEDGLNRLHVLFYDVTGNRLRHAWRSSGAWSVQTVQDDPGLVTDGTYNAVDLAAGPAGDLHAAWVDGQDTEVWYARWESSNGQWVAPTRVSTDAVSMCSIVVDDLDTPHILYDLNSSNPTVEHAWLSEQWQSEPVDSSSAARPDAVIGDDGAIHVAYVRGSDGALRYATDEDGWTTSTVSSARSVDEAEIAVAGLDLLITHVTDAGELRSIEANGMSDELLLDGVGTGVSPSAHTDGNGGAFLSFRDGRTGENDLQIARWDGSWNMIAEDSSADVGLYSSIERRSSGSLAVSYYAVSDQDLKVLEIRNSF